MAKLTRILSSTSRTSSWPVPRLSPSAIKNIGGTGHSDVKHATLFSQVIISDSGFSSGARSVAAEKRIVLRSHESSDTVDWNALFGVNTWTLLAVVAIDSDRAFIHTDEEQIREINTATQIYNAEYRALGTVRELWFKAWNKTNSMLIGDVHFILKGGGTGLFLEQQEGRSREAVDKIAVRNTYR